MKKLVLVAALALLPVALPASAAGDAAPAAAPALAPAPALETPLDLRLDGADAPVPMGAQHQILPQWWEVDATPCTTLGETRNVTDACNYLLTCTCDHYFSRWELYWHCQWGC